MFTPMLPRVSRPVVRLRFARWARAVVPHA